MHTQSSQQERLHGQNGRPGPRLTWASLPLRPGVLVCFWRCILLRASPVGSRPLEIQDTNESLSGECFLSVHACSSPTACPNSVARARGNISEAPFPKTDAQPGPQSHSHFADPADPGELQLATFPLRFLNIFRLRVREGGDGPATRVVGLLCYLHRQRTWCRGAGVTPSSDCRVRLWLS